MPTFGSLFTGIGGLDLGLERAGWRCLWQCEIDPYRRGVLERWWPGVSRGEDVREATPSGRGRPVPGELGGERDGSDGGRSGSWSPDSHVDLICGGFPCQDVSVAGLRAGLSGDRSGLFFEFARIVDAVRPRWVLIENVPGLLSSQGGRDFAIVLSTLADLGYGVAWRVLDSRYFGVPQRRRRVFVVGHLGARSADPFLPFLEGGEGHPAAGGEAREEPAGALGGGARVGGPDHYYVEDFEDGTPTASNDGPRTDRKPMIITDPVTSKWAKGAGGPAGDEAQNLVTHALTSEGHDASEDGTGRGTPLVETFQSRIARNGRGQPSDVVPALRGAEEGATADSRPLLAFSIVPESGQGADLRASQVDTVPAMSRAVGEKSAERGVRVVTAPTLSTKELTGGVRRLTPIECCRLQGFPDDWLGGNEPPDSPKYAALGDAVTVPVSRWIGERLLEAS